MAGSASVARKRLERVVLRQARCRSASPDTRCARCAPRDRPGRACRRASARAPARAGRRAPTATPRAARRPPARSTGGLRRAPAGLRRTARPTPAGSPPPIRRCPRWRRARRARAPCRLASRTHGRRRRPVPCAVRTHRDRPAARSRSSAGDRGASEPSAPRRADAPPPRSARPPRPRSSNSVSRSISSSFLPSKNSCVRCTASSYCSFEQIAATHGAMQRLMSYSRHGRSRVPVMTSLHDRMPNSRCVSPIVRRASDAGMNGPA